MSDCQRASLMISVSPGWMVAEASLLLRCNWATVVLYSAAMLDSVSPGLTRWTRRWEAVKLLLDFDLAAVVPRRAEAFVARAGSGSATARWMMRIFPGWS